MGLFGHDEDINDKFDDKLHEEKGRWEERINSFKESLLEHLDERDATIDAPEYDETVDEHL